MTKRAFTIRPFDDPADRAGVLKLWNAVAGFDGGVPARSAEMLAALVGHPTARGGSAWRVAVAGNGALVGVMDVRFVGTVRTELSIAVNPAWRRQGIGAALLAEAPPDKRLLVTTRESVAGATALMNAAGFSERWRDARLRRRTKGLEPIEPPEGVKIVEDATRDPARAAAALQAVFGDDADADEAALRALLARPGASVLYSVVQKADHGVCLVVGNERAKKGERDHGGEPTVGLVEQVGLTKEMRGRGLSRSLVRAGMLRLARSGFLEIEVLADRRRPSAVELYEKEGFAVVDEDIHWIRKDA